MVSKFLLVLHGPLVVLAGILCVLCLFLLLECLAALLPLFPWEGRTLKPLPDVAEAHTLTASAINHLGDNPLEEHLQSDVRQSDTGRNGAVQVGSHPWYSTRVAVVMPAHNESAVIAATLNGLVPQLKQTDRLIVVADNCSDQTAAIARSFGARVLERHDALCRGKGYALDHGLQYLVQDPPDVVVMIDADTYVKPGSLRALAEQAQVTRRPVQSEYMMVLPEGETDISLVSRVTVFATRVRNVVRLRGLARLGLPVILTGTGMAFPWTVISDINLASGSLVEDMKLGFDLLLAGHPPMLCPGAEVTALLPRTRGAVASQRTRWEHGRFEVTRRYLPRLLAVAVGQRKLGALALAFDLCVLPLSLLVVCVVATWGVSCELGWLTGVWGAAWVATAALASLTLAILCSWFKFGRQDLPARQFALIPFFILWKLPIYLKFFLNPQTQWVRTKREVEPPGFEEPCSEPKVVRSKDSIIQ